MYIKCRVNHERISVEALKNGEKRIYFNFVYELHWLINRFCEREKFNLVSSIKKRLSIAENFSPTSAKPH